MPGFFYVLIAMALGAALAAAMATYLLRTARAARAESRRLAEARGRCLAMVVHEMQAAGFALLGLSGELPGPATTAARHLLALADDISDSLAAEAAPRRLSQAEVPLAALLEEAIAATAAQHGLGQRQWRLSPDFAPLFLLADRRALHGALLQVLGRAARMTRPGEWIDLRPVLTAECLAIVVEDEGAGLPAGDLSGSAPDGTRGIGLGLALARSLLEAHGGALRLEAMPGIGARAWLTLPRDRLLA